MYKIFIAALFGILLSQSAIAKNSPSVDDIIKASFTHVKEVKAKRLILTKKQFSQIQKKAKTAVSTKVYRYYEIEGKNKTLGFAVLISRKVRSKKATVLYAFDNSGKLQFTEIMAFSEPPEFIPSPIWMSQLQKKSASEQLTVGKDIPTISGATLSARSVTEGARVARAIYEIVLKHR